MTIGMLTAQRDTVRYSATFETGQRAKETALFANIEQTAYPTDRTSEPNQFTSNG